jgi:hypothetical protein
VSRIRLKTTAKVRLDDGKFGVSAASQPKREGRLDFILGVAPTPTLRAHILALETRTTALFEAAPDKGKAQRYADFLVNSPGVPSEEPTWRTCSAALA